MRLPQEACVPLLCACALVSASAGSAFANGRIKFNEQIRPLLADMCFRCHGQDEKQRKGKLRLDVREMAIAKKAIIPGKADESAVVSRIFSDDPDEIMPTPKSARTLTPEQKVLLKQWIAEGAEYEVHWSFVPPARSPVPASGDIAPGLPPESLTGDETRGDPAVIDAFVGAKLKQEGLSFSPPASKEQWIRRVTFALTGLPPELEEVDAFVADQRPDARAIVVDRLLASAAHAEHLARDWLDVARYADSYGRHEDGDMYAWPWRDWVISAFRNNMPYDVFVLNQTAGDLMPGASRDQIVATAFNRFAPQSNESGNDPVEFRIDQVADRVRVNGLAFLGLSVECAKCHDHKYDPILQKEYWQMAAFFDNINENGVYSQFCPLTTPSPTLMLPTDSQEKALSEVSARIAAKEKALKAIETAERPRFDQWCKITPLPGSKKPGFWNRLIGTFGRESRYDWKPKAEVRLAFEKIVGKEQGSLPEIANEAKSSAPAKLRTRLDVVSDGAKGTAMLFKGDDEITLPKYGDELHEWSEFTFAIWLRPAEDRDRAVVLARSRGGIDDGRGYEVLLEHLVPSFALMHFHPGNEIRIKAREPLPLNKWTHLAFTYDGSSRASGMKLYVNGVPAVIDIVNDNLIRDIVRRQAWGDIDLDQIRFTIGGRQHDGSLKNCAVDEFYAFDREISPGEVKLLAGLEADTKDDWFAWWLRSRCKEWNAANKMLRVVRRERTHITNDIPDMMVMREMPRQRVCYVHPRGDFRQTAEMVEPGTPRSILPFAESLPKNRLGFARWLLSPENPLTARVEVNRLWQLLVGRGLVGTPQDFGTRGELPSHPELLDWLACDFREHGWDVRRLCRMIVLSGTFAQSSAASAAMLERDPENRRLSRGPAVRLSAEEVRDQALALSGLLVRKVGGPSVKPYLPSGLYALSGLQQRYTEDSGEGLYRRSLYTFWKRTLPPPNLAVFDAPSREFCVVKRERTSTPLQALALFNDPQFVEAQRVLAEKLVREFPADDEKRCAKAFRLCTCRSSAAKELAVLVRLLREQRRYFAGAANEALAFLNNGASEANLSLPAVEIAATGVVTRVVMNHEETLMR